MREPQMSTQETQTNPQPAAAAEDTLVVQLLRKMVLDTHEYLSYKNHVHFDWVESGMLWLTRNSTVEQHIEIMRRLSSDSALREVFRISAER